MGTFKKTPDFFISLSFQDKAIIIITLFLGVFFGMFYGIAWWGNAKAGAIVGLVISITANLILLPLKNWIAGTASKIYGGRAAHWSLREQLEGDLNQAKHLKYSILIGQHQNICNFFSQYVSLIQAQNIISPVSSGSNRFS